MGRRGRVRRDYDAYGNLGGDGEYAYDDAVPGHLLLASTHASPRMRNIFCPRICFFQE